MGYAIVIVLLLIAVYAPQLWVQRVLNRFNREAEDFNKEPEDRDSVTICYNKLSTTPEMVFDLANTECGKYAKQARHVFQLAGF